MLRSLLLFRSIRITGTLWTRNSGSLSIIIFEKSSQSLLTLNRSLITPHRSSLRGKQECIPSVPEQSFGFLSQTEVQITNHIQDSGLSRVQLVGLQVLLQRMTELPLRDELACLLD